MADARGRLGLTERLARWPTGGWKVIAAAAGVVGAALTGIVLYQITGPSGRVLWTVGGGVFGGAAGSGGVLALYTVLKSYQELKDTRAELQALINVRPLTGRLPLDLGGWAADPVLADRAVRLLLKRRPQRVVECGSGWSTVLMACCLCELGEGKVVALEHLEHFANRTRDLLDRYGVSDWARVVHAPIEEVEVDGETRPWYRIKPRKVLDGTIDVLVVDGPPSDLAPRSRYPAVPMFEEQIAESWAVLLDDGRREDEAWIAERWGRRLGVDPTFDRGGRGIYLLESVLQSTVSEDSRTDGSVA